MYQINSLEFVLSQLNPAKELFFDTETIGLYGKIRLAQFYQEHWREVIIVDRPKIFELIAFFSKIKDTSVVMQKSHYDITTIQENVNGRFIIPKFEDTFYLGRLALPYAESFALDDMMEAVLEFNPYKHHNIDKSETQKSNWAALVLSDKQLTYAAIDVFYLPQVYKAFEAFRDDISYKLDMHNVRKALDFQRNGMFVIEEQLEAIFASNLRRIKEIALPINANSYQQVRPYINSAESDDLALQTLALQGNARAAAVSETRKLLKQNSFIEKFYSEDNRIYGKFEPSARSGRYTCKDQNLQQIPRKLKNCFGAAPGNVLLYGDYPQLELRTIAAIAKEKKLIELFKAGGDPHATVAAQIFGPDWTAEDRQVTKTYNFNLLYCGGAGMVQSILIKQGTWRDLHKIKREAALWKSSWPGIARWQEECIRSHRRGALKSTPFGRRYLGARLTDHANIENQGFGAEIAKLALHYMYDDLKANEAMLTNFVHDSYFVEMPEDETANRRVASIMRDAMKEAWFEGCKMTEVKDIPMPAKVACGKNWGEIENKNFIFEVS